MSNPISSPATNSHAPRPQAPNNALDLAALVGMEPEDEKDTPHELPSLEGVSLSCMGPHSHFRLICQRLVTHWAFDTFIIILIIVSSVCLALDVPRLEPTSVLKAVLDQLNLAMTALFVMEMLLKVRATVRVWAFLGSTLCDRDAGARSAPPPHPTPLHPTLHT